jgi:amino acid adenylation domain-containing protein
MQQAMLAHGLAHPGDGADVEQLLITLNEGVDADVLRRAWDHVTLQHDALQIAFDWGGEVVLQRRDPAARMEWRCVDLATLDLEAWLQADRARGFLLNTAPLHRAALLRRSSCEAVLVWTVHHLIVDGRSFARVMREVFDAYDAIQAGRTPHPVHPVPHAEFARRLEALETTRARQHWRHVLAGEPVGARVVIHDPPPRPFVQGDAPHREVRRAIESADLLMLERRADAWQVSLGTLVHAAWALVLSWYSNADDIVMGMIRSVRRLAGSEAVEAVGMFIDAVPFRVRVDPDEALQAWLACVRADQVALRDLPPVSVEGSAGAFDTLVLFEGEPWEEKLRALGGVWAQREMEVREQTSVPLTLAVYRRTRLDLRFEYDVARYAEVAIRQLLDHVVAVLLQLAGVGLSATVRDIKLPADVERAALLTRWNATTRPRDPALTVVDLIERQVRDRGEAPALTADGVTLTYRELDERAGRLAAALRGAGVESGEPVALLLPRGRDLGIAVLATMKAGAAYLPVDPDYPDERIRAMLADSGTRFGVAPAGAAAYPGVCWLPPEAGDANTYRAPPTSAPGDRLAYVLYTSGSTGRPKGVEVLHRSLLNLVWSAQENYALMPTDRVLQFCSPSFDSSVEEIFMTWCAGAHLLARAAGPPPPIRDFMAELERLRITVLDLPTAFWNVWMGLLATSGERIPAGVRLIIVGGEVARVDTYRAMRNRAEPAMRWVNTYGPAECTVVATLFEPGDPHSPDGGVPIGTPIPNTHAYVVDHWLRPLPVGVEGELVLGGIGVARGYRRNEAGTRERFIPDTLGGVPDARLYRTGDRAWRRGDGVLVFAGRMDQQVKIRGFRVEPAEIEAALHACPGVRDAVVVAIETPNGETALRVHWIAEPPFVAEEELRVRLNQCLPSFMLPSAWMRMEAFPLSPNGKVDRKALAAMREDASAARVTEPPRGDLEVHLAALWSQVLGVPEIGRVDDFFRLGGDSLSALMLIQLLHRLGYELPVAEMFRRSTLEDMTRALRPVAHAEATGHDAVVRLREGGSDAPPLWLLPSDFGDLLIYANLLPHLDPLRTVYGLQCARLTPDHPGLGSMHNLAAHFTRHVRAAQPRGPYQLAGYCFGGFVALEMARLLEAEGERVAFLGLLDARPIRPPRDLNFWIMMLQGLWRARPADWTRHLRARMEAMRLTRSIDRMARQMPEQLDPRELNRWKLETQVLPGYRSLAYNGRLAFFYPEESRYELYGDPSCGWLHLAEQVWLIKTPGSHLNMMKKPHVGTLAQRLEGCLDVVKNGR